MVDMVRASTSAAGLRCLSSIRKGGVSKIRPRGRCVSGGRVPMAARVTSTTDVSAAGRRCRGPARLLLGSVGGLGGRGRAQRAAPSSRRRGRREGVLEAHESGSALTPSARSAGVGRSTAYRWLERRFGELRTTGMSRRRTQRLLRLSDLVTPRPSSDEKTRSRPSAVRR